MISSGEFLPGRLLSLWEIMQRFDAGKLFISVTGLSNMGHSVPNAPGMSQAFAIPFAVFEEVKKTVDFVCAELANIGLATSLISAETIRGILASEVVKKPIFRISSELKWRSFPRRHLADTETMPLS